MKHVDVVCAVIKKGDKYFCCQRNGNTALPYKWEFPGGKIELNETKENALIREIKEELNSTISIIEYLGVVNHAYEKIDKPFSITIHAYLCKLESGSLELVEHASSMFATIEEMKSMDFAEADIPFLTMLK